MVKTSMFHVKHTYISKKDTFLLCFAVKKLYFTVEKAYFAVKKLCSIDFAIKRIRKPHQILRNKFPKRKKSVI